MPFGMVVLVIAAVLIYFGLAQRLLDRMRLTDKTALLMLFLIFIGGFVDITIARQPVEVILNLGGAIIPVGLAIWLLATADTVREKWRGAGAALLTGGAIWLSSEILPSEPTETLIEPIYMFAIIGAVTAYLLGRSRRAAFVAGITGVILANLFDLVQVLAAGQRSRFWIGGAGAFDAVIITGLLAVALAEVVGETAERIQGGPRQGQGRPDELKNVEFTEALGTPAPNKETGSRDEGKEKAHPKRDVESSMGLQGELGSTRATADTFQEKLASAKEEAKEFLKRRQSAKESDDDA